VELIYDDPQLAALRLSALQLRMRRLKGDEGAEARGPGAAHKLIAASSNPGESLVPGISYAVPGLGHQSVIVFEDLQSTIPKTLESWA
jgi:hypothetical protein